MRGRRKFRSASGALAIMGTSKYLVIPAYAGMTKVGASRSSQITNPSTGAASQAFLLRDARRMAFYAFGYFSKFSNVVIPAKAGIQSFVESNTWRDWVPAFDQRKSLWDAGTTTFRKVPFWELLEPQIFIIPAPRMGPPSTGRRFF